MAAALPLCLPATCHTQSSKANFQLYILIEYIHTYIHTYIYIYILFIISLFVSFYLFLKIIVVQRICLFYHINFQNHFSLISISRLTRCGVSVLFPPCCSPLCSLMLGIAHLLYLPHCVSLLPPQLRDA